MGHSRALWKLKPKQRKSRRVRFPDCPLCNKPMLPKEKLKTISVNGRQVQVHKDC